MNYAKLAVGQSLVNLAQPPDVQSVQEDVGVNGTEGHNQKGTAVQRNKKISVISTDSQFEGKMVNTDMTTTSTNYKKKNRADQGTFQTLSP